MYRYFALIWNRADATAAATARFIAARRRSLGAQWTQVFDGEGLIALHAGVGTGSCETRLIGERDGAVFGRLFRSGFEQTMACAGQPLGPDAGARVLATRGAELFENYWGRYVAAVHDEQRGETSVLRDPSGALPCFVTEHRGVHIVFSDIESWRSLGLARFSINWGYLASLVAYSALQIRATGLNEVTEVQCGERLTFKDGHIERTLLWNPVSIARLDRIENPVTAVEAVRGTVQRCVHAWASLHRTVIHNLSGGLDSSIVLSCLINAPTRPAVTCLHYFSSQTREDERRYARLAADHLRAELVEHDLATSPAGLERLLSIQPSPKPWSYIYDLLHSPIEARLAREKGATGLFSGSGGDGLFLQARADLAVADYLRHHGPNPAVLRVALNAARITRTSIWPILRRGLQLHLRSTRGEVHGAHHPGALVPRAVFKAAHADDELIHPWIRAAEGLTPGLLWHVLCLSVPPAFYDSFGDETEVERTMVLMSQPLIELCLRIPSYVWISGGYDRAIARRAFSPVLPADIVRRTDKGAIDRYNRRMIDANETFMREMLLDGELANAGLLDRKQLDLHLRTDRSPAGFEYNEILRRHLCTEVWVRRWRSVQNAACSNSAA